MPRTANMSVHNSKNMSYDASLTLYLKEISRHAPLSSEQEARLTERIRGGDRRALHKLVLANLRFVVSVCMNYRNQGLPLNDLINEGNLGLIRAAKRFDEKKNFKFISYAVWWIRQAILQALAEHSRIVRLPLNRVGSIHKIGKAQSRLEQHHQRLPTVDEIAQELQVRSRDVQRMIQVGNRHTSLDAPMDNRQGNLYDKISMNQNEPVEDSLMKISLREEIAKVLDRLEGREKDVIKLYFGIDNEIALTLEEIGNRYNITRERVRQIKETALAKLKHSRMNGGLRIFYHHS